MSKPMKFSLVLFVCGIVLCGLAILYAKVFSATGSQPVFITFYMAGALSAGFGGGRAVYLLIPPKRPGLKILGVLFAVVVFAVVIVGLFSPFYMLSEPNKPTKAR